MDSQPSSDQPSTRPSSDHDGHCWVICPTQTASPDMHTPEANPHYSSRAEAIAAVSDLEDIPVRLPQPCYFQTCDSCQDDFTDDDIGGVVHWLTPAAAAREASGTGWTSDGRAWHCPDCPELTDTDHLAWGTAPDPGRGAQLLPGMGIVSADVDILGAVGVLPEQASTRTHLGDADEDGAQW